MIGITSEFFVQGLIACLLGVIWWKIRKIDTKVDSLSVHREFCLREFAAKSDISRVDKRIDEIDTQLEEVSRDLHKLIGQHQAEGGR